MCHVQQDSKEESVKRPKCEYKAKSEYNLEDHILDEHNYPCGDFVIIFRNLDKLKNSIIENFKSRILPLKPFTVKTG